MMERYIEKGGKRLRLGYTTGSCAAAAAKAAAWMLLTGTKRERISIMTPKGIPLDLEIKQIERGDGFVSCAIEKDSGDDPDATRGTLVFSRVALTDAEGIHIDGGVGVGRVTKPGLDQKVGNAAINSVPRKMIEENLTEVMKTLDYSGGLDVTISVPDGEKLAKKTFNPRLGIVGGISILGTTGIVEPMSEQALIDTIRVELRQRKAEGRDYVLIVPGNYGADFIRDSLKIAPETAVQSSNFIGDTLDMCRELGFKGVLLVGHIGKLVKIAGGMFNTHSRYGDCRMEIMTSQAALCGIRAEAAEKMLECVACDDALRVAKEEGICEELLEKLMSRIEKHLEYRSGGEMETAAVTFSKVYGFLGKTTYADRLTERITEE